MFTDFQCPFCRQLHGVVGEAIARHPGRIRLQRLMFPLPSHSGAEPAALAYLCVPQDQREAMADKLYAAPVGSLTPDGVAKMAAELGVTPAVLWPCVRAEATSDKIVAHKKIFLAAKLSGLPSTYVEDQLVNGADQPAFERALSYSLQGRGGLATAWLLGLSGLLLVAATGLSLAQAGGQTTPADPQTKGAQPSEKS